MPDRIIAKEFSLAVFKIKAAQKPMEKTFAMVSRMQIGKVMTQHDSKNRERTKKKSSLMYWKIKAKKFSFVKFVGAKKLDNEPAKIDISVAGVTISMKTPADMHIAYIINNI